MPRYELVEGTSNKFWEITLAGTSFTTTYGKIGANGQTTIKKFASAAEARLAHDKLVAEKVKKGYVAVGGKAAKTTSGKPNGKAAAAAPAPAAGGARYFEYVEGTSSKFWEVSIDNKRVKTRYGKIGAAGQTTVKDFDSKPAAQAEANRLVAEKVKKGYVEGGAGAAPSKTAAAIAGKADARNPELEAAIVADPHDRDAWTIYADWLQEQGDPRGELMSLQLAGQDKQAQKLLDKHVDYFLGPIAEHQTVHDEGYNNSSSHLRTREQEKEWQKTQKQAFLWRNGFIYRVRLSHDEYSDSEFDGKTVDILAQVLRHPSARFVVEFSFQSNGDPSDDNLQDLINLLGKKAPPTTRKITFGDNVDQISWHHTGSLAKLWPGVPNLKVLEIETGEFEVGKMVAPALERAVFITGGLSKSCGKGLATAEMPEIRHLEIYYGTENYGGTCSIKEVRPLLERGDLAHLEYLGLKNSEFANELAREVGGAKVVKHLKTLDLSLGTMTDDGARALADAKASLAHLECLDLRDNFLTKEGVKLVKGLCKQVLTDGQQTPYDYGDELHYYVSISE
jgi:uncharacterized protein (TIGR02996 family)